MARSKPQAKNSFIFYDFTSVNLTNHQKLSINTIDFFSKVCYTEDKLENKIKILTNK